MFASLGTLLVTAGLGGDPAAAPDSAHAAHGASAAGEAGAAGARMAGVDSAVVETAPGASLAHALEHTPGWRVTSSGEQVGAVVLGGAARPRLLVQDAGLPAEDFGWLETDAPSIQPGFVGRAAAVRGPLAALFGTDALLGAVLVSPPPFVASGNAPSGGLLVEAASATRAGATRAHFEGASGAFAWRVQGAAASGGDLRTPDGRLHHTGFERWDGDIAACARGAAGSLALRWVHHGGAFDLRRDRASNPVRDLQDDRLQLQAEHHVSGVRLEARAQWQRRRLEVAPGDIDLRLGSGVVDLAGHLGRGRWSGVFGVRGGERTWDSHGATRLVPRTHGVAGAAFTYHAWRTRSWLWHGGAAFDLWHLDSDADLVLRQREETRNERRWSGGGGFVFAPHPALAVDVHGGRATRAPTPFELFARGPDPDRGTFVLGDAALEPESATGIAADIRWSPMHLEMRLGAFVHDVDGFAFLRPQAGTRDGLPLAAFAPGDARLAGGEARIRGSIRDTYVLQAGLEGVRGRDRTLGVALPGVPPFRFTAGALRRGRGSRPSEPWTASVDVELVAGSEAPPGEIETAPYALVHLGATWTFPWDARPLSVAAALRNAANTRYHDALSSYRGLAPAAGRDLRLRLGVEF